MTACAPCELDTTTDEVTTEMPFMLVRETPAWKTRDRWNRIKTVREELTLHADLDRDDDLLPLPPPTLTRFQEIIEAIGAVVCRFLHRPDMFEIDTGRNFLQCGICRRKYAMPWAVTAKLDGDVFRPSVKFVKPDAPTVQALCRNGTQSSY